MTLTPTETCGRSRSLGLGTPSHIQTDHRLTNPRPSLRDIAERAHVSKATVSLALRNHPRISAPVRERIQALAQEMGYAPDPLIARIAANGWNARREQGHTAVAFISGANSEPPFIKPLRMVGPKMGYRVDHFALSDYRSPQRLADVLVARGISGILLHQISDPGFVKRFPWHRFATIACGLSICFPPVHVVGHNYILPVQGSWEICLRAGYRRIGFALLREMNPHDKLTRTGIADYLEYHAADKTDGRVSVEHFSITDQKLFLDWVKAQRLDAVIGLNDIFHWWLTDGGLRAPQDIGFLSLARDAPQISGWDTCNDLVARCSLEQLDLMIRSAATGLPERPYSLDIQQRWEPGTTLRGAPAAR